MYDFVYCVSFKKYIKHGFFTARYQATLITFFAMYLHVCVLFAAAKMIFVQQFEAFGNDNRLGYLLAMTVIGFFVLKYYNKKSIDLITTAYELDVKRKFDSVKVVLIIVVPILIGALLLTMRVPAQVTEPY